MQKSIRTWVYWLVQYKDKIIVIKKGRWPFTWLYDLPGGKIEHWEKNKDSLKRELQEELWLLENDFEIQKLLTVEEDFVKHIWKWEEKDEHIIAIVYLVKIILGNIDFSYVEKWWDAKWFSLIEKNDTKISKTNFLKRVLENKNINNIWQN